MNPVTLTLPARYRPFAEAVLSTAVDRIRREISAETVPGFVQQVAAEGAVTITVTVLAADIVVPQAQTGVAA